MLPAQEDKGTDSAFDRDVIPICQLASYLMSLGGSHAELEAQEATPRSLLLVFSSGPLWYTAFQSLLLQMGELERNKTYMEGNVSRATPISRFCASHSTSPITLVRPLGLLLVAWLCQALHLWSWQGRVCCPPSPMTPCKGKE